MQRLVMKNLVAQLSKDVVQREETRMPNSSTTFSKSTTWMPSVDASMVLSGDKTAKIIRTAETWRGPNTEYCDRRGYLTKPAGSGVGALVAQNRYQRHRKKKHTKGRDRSQEQRRTGTSQPERPTGKARKRRPDRADPTSLPWELERDARGRQKTSLPFRF